MHVLTAGNEVGEDLGGDRNALTPSQGDGEPADLLKVAPLGPEGGPRVPGRFEADQPPLLFPALEDLGRRRRAQGIAGEQIVETDEGVGAEEPTDDRLLRSRLGYAGEGRCVEGRFLRADPAHRLGGRRQFDFRGSPLRLEFGEEPEHRAAQVAGREVSQAS